MSSKEQFIDKAFVVGREKLHSGEIPSIVVYGNTAPEAWENSVLATYEWGCSIPTQHDQDIDPESKDATLMTVIANPQEEQKIHLELPGG